MKILNIVVASVWGGGEQYVYDTARALGRKDVDVFVAVDCKLATMRKRYTNVAKVITANFNSFMCMGALRTLTNAIRENHIDIIVCHSGHAMFLCLLIKFITNVKLIMVKHNAIMQKNDFYHKWQRSNTDAFVCVSKLVYDLQTQVLSDNEKEKYHLVYNGIDTDRFFYREKVNDIVDTFVIGYAGRIANGKGVDVLVDAVRILKDKNYNLKLLLAGADEKGYLNKIRQLIDESKLNDSVEYLGLLKDMREFYSKLDVFVLPSVVKESFGLVLCEAMYSGVPVITTDSGAQREIITEGETGFVVKAGSPKDLSNCLAFLLENRMVCEKLSKKAHYDIVKRFTSERCAEQLYVIIESVK